MNLFDVKEFREPLSLAQRQNAVKKIVLNAKLKNKLSYTTNEACGILHWSKDQMFDALHFFKLDSFEVLSCVRIPWWSLAEFLLFPGDEIDAVFNKWINSIPQKTKDKK